MPPAPFPVLPSRSRVLGRVGVLLGGLLLAAPGWAAQKPLPVQVCEPAPLNNGFPQAEGTKQMAALVDRIYREADVLRNPFRSSDQLPVLKEKDFRGTTDTTEGLATKIQLALHSLQAGRHEEAIAAYQEVERYAVANNLPIDDPLRILVLTGQAMAYLRAGETANCVLNHNADSCIFPIKDGGIHQIPDGSRAAIGVLTELLTKYPGELRARWLLNIAYMTLGEYPDKVPPRWRIDPKFFASDYDLPRFPDIAASVGLDVNGLAGGVVLEDFDHDGFLDVMMSAWGFTPQDQLRVFRNNGDGTFAERTDAAGLKGLLSGLNLIQGDYNNDGFADVLVLRGAWLRTEGHYPFSLLRNNGDFTFTDVTAEAGLGHFMPTQTAVWFDFNGDGWLDIFVGNETTTRDVNPCELFRNNGDGTFTEVAAETGVDLVGFVKGVAAGDYNNDGRPDLFISTRGGPKYLLRNDGPVGADGPPKARWKFTDVAEAAGISGPFQSFPCMFWDYDNDGWLDIMVTGYMIQDAGDIAADYMGRPTSAQKSKLYHNNGDGTFTDVSRAAGVNKVILAMGANFGDLDNDGWLDVYFGTGDPDFTTLVPNRMFRNDGGKRFQEVTTAGGFGQLQKGHAIAFGDLNNDGTQEIFSKVGGAVETDNYHSQLFLGPGFGNHWIKLQLEGQQTNRVAIGARIKVVVEEAGQERALHRVVGTGASFGANPLRQEIGLGQAKTVKRVEIFWPVSGATQVLTGFNLDRTYRIREGEAGAVELALKHFTYPATPPPGARSHSH